MAVFANLDENTLASLTKRTSLLGGNIAIVDKKTTVLMSNTMTGIQNAFNRILTYSKNMNKIQEAKLEATSYSNKEQQLEAPRAAPIAQASATSTSDDALAEIIPDLLKVVKKLDDKLQNLDLNSGNGLDLSDLSDLSDIDIERRSKPRGRIRGRLGKVGRFAKGAAFAAAAGYVIDAGFGMFGVGKGLNQEALDKQDDANWERMSLLNKAESSVARGIEAAGDLFFLDNISAQAKASRIRDETAYLDERDKEKNPKADLAAQRNKSQSDKLVNVATKAATKQAVPVKKEAPTKAVSKQGNDWTGKVSAFIGDTYRNVTSFMGGFLAKLASIGSQIGDFLSGGVQNVAGWFGFGGGPGFQQADLRGARGEWARDNSFISGVNALAKKYNIDAGDLLGLMQSESNLNPQARNPSGATGLIQFMPTTARALGTSTDAIYRMNRTQQLSLVDKFFEMNKLPSGATAGQLYASVFLPAYTRKADNFVVARANGPNDAGKVQPAWYNQNAGLDSNRDGAITIADLGQRLSKKRQEIGLGPSRAGSGFQAIGNLAMGAYNAAGSALSSLSDYAQRAVGFKPPLASIRSRSGASVQVAAPYARNFQGFINDLEATGYKIRALGGYSDRANVNNSKYKSFHAAGAAIDINPAQNPNGKARITDMPINTVNMLIRKWGLGWGFNFRSISDAMHFSIADFEGGSVKIPRVLNTGRPLMMMPGEASGQYAAATGKSTGSAVSPAKPQVAPAATLPGKAQTVAIDKKKQGCVCPGQKPQPKNYNKNSWAYARDNGGARNGGKKVDPRQQYLAHMNAH